MYVKAINGVVEKYPYSIGDLRKDNPQTSFPKNPSNELLAGWNVFPVNSVSYPDHDHTKNVTEANPVLQDGNWTQTWIVTNATQEEINRRTADRATTIRAERDGKLQETDWLVIKAYETNTNIPAEWEIYRQALRDVPSQPGFPWNVTWPVKP